MERRANGVSNDSICKPCRNRTNPAGEHESDERCDCCLGRLQGHDEGEAVAGAGMVQQADGQLDPLFTARRRFAAGPQADAHIGSLSQSVSILLSARSAHQGRSPAEPGLIRTRGNTAGADMESVVVKGRLVHQTVRFSQIE